MHDLNLPADLEALESLPVGAGGTIQFDFDYRLIQFRALWDQESEKLRVAGSVAQLPFSAQAPAARASLAQTVFEANDALGPSFRLMGNHILIGCDSVVHKPLTASKAIAAVAAMLIPLIPYLDVLHAYVKFPLELKPGQRALRKEWLGKPLPHLNVRTRYR